MEEDNTSKKRQHESISVTSDDAAKSAILDEEKSHEDDNFKGADTEDNEDANGSTNNELNNGASNEDKNNDGSDSDVNSKSKRDERRLEMNRQRAKDIRRRKKKMMEEMQKQIVFLTMENNKLRTQNQMQQAEINLLRGSQQEQMLLHSNGQQRQHPLVNNDILNLIRGRNTNPLADNFLAGNLLQQRTAASSLMDPTLSQMGMEGNGVHSPSLQNPTIVPSSVQHPASMQNATSFLMQPHHMSAANAAASRASGMNNHNSNDAASRVGLAGLAGGALGGGSTNPLQSAGLMNSNAGGTASLLNQIQTMDADDSRKNQALLDFLIENQQHQQQQQHTNGGPSMNTHMNREMGRR